MIDIRLGDAREVLKGVTADTIITDPVWPNVPEGLLPGWERPAELLREVLEVIEARRLVVVIREDSDPRFLTAVPDKWEFFRIQILPYVMPSRNGRKLIEREVAYCFGEPIPSAEGQRVIPGMARKAQPGKKIDAHPCARNLGHMEYLIRWWTMPGETVCDPFAGSGTTARACYRMKRNFIGAEIEPKYYELAQRLIREEQSQLHLFREAAD